MNSGIQENPHIAVLVSIATPEQRSVVFTFDN